MQQPTEILNINLVNTCYEIIESLIINGTFTPGKKLKTRELKQITHAGGSPIREALSRLTMSGLVTAKNNKGFYVASVSEADIKDVYHTFLQIELLALHQAMRTGDDAWKTGIIAALYNLSLVEQHTHNPTVEAWITRNYEFHNALVAGCNSPTLLRIRADVYRTFDRYCRMSFALVKQSLSCNYNEHKQLADAVLERNDDLVTTIITNHILGSLSDVIALFKKNALM